MKNKAVSIIIHDCNLANVLSDNRLINIIRMIFAVCIVFYYHSVLTVLKTWIRSSIKHLGGRFFRKKLAAFSCSLLLQRNTSWVLKWVSNTTVIDDSLFQVFRNLSPFSQYWLLQYCIGWLLYCENIISPKCILLSKLSQ